MKNDILTAARQAEQERRCLVRESMDGNIRLRIILDRYSFEVFILVVINVFKTKADITTNPLAIVGKHGFTMKNFPEAMRASVLGNGSFHGHSVSGSDGTARLSIRRNARSPESQTFSFSDAGRILGIYGDVHVPRSDSHEHTA